MSIYDVECITKFENLPAAYEWHVLNYDVPFLSWEWMSSWWETMGEENQIFTLVARDIKGDLIAIAPFYVHRSRTRGRVLRFFGDGATCSDYTNLISAEGHAETAIQVFAKWLRKAAKGHFGPEYVWNALELDGIAENNETIRRLLDAVGTSNQLLETESQHTWRISLPRTWDEYLSQRGKRRRNMLRKIDKNFNLNDRASLTIANSSQEVDEFLNSLIHLHTLRRNDLNCGGCFSDERFEPFLRMTAKRFFDVGKLWLTQLTLDGKVAANALGIRQSDTIFMYQCGFDPELRDLRPGWIQNINILKRAMGEGVKFLDFLRGDELYKSQLGGEPTKLLRFRAPAPSVVSRVRTSVFVAVGKAYQSMDSIKIVQKR